MMPRLWTVRKRGLSVAIRVGVSWQKTRIRQTLLARSVQCSAIQISSPPGVLAVNSAATWSPSAERLIRCMVAKSMAAAT
jgi:hypothetical protein